MVLLLGATTAQPALSSLMHALRKDRDRESERRRRRKNIRDNYHNVFYQFVYSNDENKKVNQMINMRSFLDLIYFLFDQHIEAKERY